MADNPNTSIKLPDGSIVDVPGSRGNPYWAEKLDVSLSQIKISGKLIFFGTPPAPVGGSLAVCTDSKLRLTDKCFGDASSFPLGKSAAREIQKKLIAKNGGVYVDPLPWLCLKNTCPPIIDKSPVFSDGSHFNPLFVAKLGSFFKQYTN
jgi:hypothetical protein